MSWFGKLIWWLFFKPRSSRQIFAFFDGRTLRHADPLEVYRGFATHQTFDWHTVPPLLTVDDPQVQLEASREIAEAVRDVFGISDFDQGGLTESECRDLFDRTCHYFADVKKKHSRSRTSPPPTESTSSTAAAETTSLPSDSTSTSDAPTTGEPSLSPEESGGDSATPLREPIEP